MESQPSYDEARLIRTFQLSEPEEARQPFGELYGANDPRLRRYLANSLGLHQFEIDEVCSVVWERAAKKLSTYRATEVPYLVWLIRAAILVLKETYRAKVGSLKNPDPLTDEDIEDISDWGQDPLLSLLEAEHEQELIEIREEIRVAVRDLMEELSPDQRDVLTARNDLELSPKETAEFLGWRVEKVYSDYYRGLSRLREGLLRKFGRVQVAQWQGKRPGD